MVIQETPSECLLKVFALVLHFKNAKWLLIIARDTGVPVSRLGHWSSYSGIRESLRPFHYGVAYCESQISNFLLIAKPPSARVMLAVLKNGHGNVLRFAF